MQKYDLIISWKTPGDPEEYPERDECFADDFASAVEIAEHRVEELDEEHPDREHRLRCIITWAEVVNEAALLG